MTDVASKLTFKQHLRAFVRWCTPWETETQAMLIVITVFYIIIAAMGLAFQNYDVALAVTGLYWLIWQVFLTFRAALTVMMVVASLRSDSTHAMITWKEIWHEKAAKPLFMRFYARRRDTAYLRSQGYPRKVARKWSRLLSAPSIRY